MRLSDNVISVLVKNAILQLKYNPHWMDEPRDWHGRWTRIPGGSVAKLPPGPPQREATSPTDPAELAKMRDKAANLSLKLKPIICKTYKDLLLGIGRIIPGISIEAIKDSFKFQMPSLAQWLWDMAKWLRRRDIAAGTGPPLGAPPPLPSFLIDPLTMEPTQWNPSGIAANLALVFLGGGASSWLKVSRIPIIGAPSNPGVLKTLAKNFVKAVTDVRSGNLFADILGFGERGLFTDLKAEGRGFAIAARRIAATSGPDAAERWVFDNMMKDITFVNLTAATLSATAAFLTTANENVFERFLDITKPGPQQIALENALHRIRSMINAYPDSLFYDEDDTIMLNIIQRALDRNLEDCDRGGRH